MKEEPIVDVSDRSLIERMQSGDMAAFDELFERHRRPIYAYVRGMLMDSALAEDVTQETFLVLVRRVQSVDPARGVSPWLFRVARNRAIDLLRKRRHEVPGGGPEEAARPPADEESQQMSPAERLLESERHIALRQGLQMLDAASRDILTMHYFGGLTFREISDVLRRPLGTVLWMSRRGLKRLAQAMADNRDIRQ